MWDFLRSVLGDITRDEAVLVGLFFACVLLYSWFPKLGEAVGATFERDDDGAQ